MVRGNELMKRDSHQGESWFWTCNLLLIKDGVNLLSSVSFIFNNSFLSLPGFIPNHRNNTKNISIYDNNMSSTATKRSTDMLIM